MSTRVIVKNNRDCFLRCVAIAPLPLALKPNPGTTSPTTLHLLSCYLLHSISSLPPSQALCRTSTLLSTALLQGIGPGRLFKFIIVSKPALTSVPVQKARQCLLPCYHLAILLAHLYCIERYFGLQSRCNVVSLAVRDLDVTSEK